MDSFFISDQKNTITAISENQYFQSFRVFYPIQGVNSNQYFIFEELNHQDHQSIAFLFLIKKTTGISENQHFEVIGMFKQFPKAESE